MEEKNTEVVNETVSEKPNSASDFENLGKNEIEIGSRVHEGHRHHHHHHHSHSSNDKTRKEEKKRKSKIQSKDKKAKGRRSFSELKRYLMGGWVAILSIVVVFLSAWNFELNSQLRAHSDRFDKLKDDSVGYVPVVDDTDNTAYTVPEYWQDAVDKAVKKIDKYTAEAGRDCTVFAWFSDTHYMEGGKNYATGAITAAVMDSCNIPFAILSGDVLTQSVLDTEEEVIAAYDAVYNMLSPIGTDRLLQVEGNHDGSYGKVDLDGNGELGDGEYYKYNMTDEQIYNYMFRQHAGDSRRVYGESGTWFYIDDPVSKTRFIMLNDVWDKYEADSKSGIAINNQMGDYGLGQEQMEWLANEALRFDEKGWAVVLSGHAPINQAEIRDGEVVLGILEAFANKGEYSGSSGEKGTWQYVDISVDFSKNKSNEIIGFYSGHVHKDSLITSLSFPMITITSNVDSSYDENEEDRVYGTDNEVAVDFVIVNRKTGEVHHVRLGVGNDRSYNY